MTIRSLMMAARGVFVATYQLSTTAIHGIAPEGETSDADLIYNTDGTVQEKRDLGAGGTSTTTSESSPWSNDPAEDGTGHHVRIASHDSGVNRYLQPGSIPTAWLALSSQRVFEWRDTDTTGPYDASSTYTVELSDDGGSSVLDSMTLTIRLENEGP